MDFKENYLHSILDDAHYNELLTFYVPYFPDEISCIDYLYKMLRHEPPHTPGLVNNQLCAIDANGSPIPDMVFVPKRMLNAVERFVSVARDMEAVRPGDDPFKIIFLITCIESLQKQRGIKFDPKKEKKEMIFDFFESFTSSADSEYIHNHFENIPDNFYEISKDGPTILAEALYSIRNAAVHAGDCWECIFPDENKGLIITVPGKKKDAKHTAYSNAIPYSKFEQIFVRTCLNLISHYVTEKHGA